MLRFKNQTKFDKHIFGLHFAEGATVPVPESIGKNELAWLRVNFTEIADEPEPVKVEASTPIIVTEPVTVEAPQEVLSAPKRTSRKKKATARRRNYHGNEV